MNEMEFFFSENLNIGMVASLNVPFTCMSFMDWLIIPVNKLTYTKKLFEELSLRTWATTNKRQNSDIDDIKHYA